MADNVYRERAHLVAFLAKVYPAVVDATDPEWPIIFVSSPEGQLSWHIAQADMDLFEDVPNAGCVTWDGHTTEQKYERLDRLEPPHTRLMP